MPHVTAARSKILDGPEFEQTRTVSNDGSDPVEVSTDKHFTYGQGIRIAPGESEVVVVHAHEDLYAICAAGQSADVSFGAAPLKPVDRFLHITEDPDLEAIVTDWPLAPSSLKFGDAVIRRNDHPTAGDVAELAAGRLFIGPQGAGVLVDNNNIEFTSNGAIAFRGADPDSAIQTYLVPRAAAVEVMKVGGGQSGVYVHAPNDARYLLSVSNGGVVTATLS